MCMFMICGYNTESEHDDSDSEPGLIRDNRNLCWQVHTVCIILNIISIMDHPYDCFPWVKEVAEWVRSINGHK